MSNMLGCTSATYDFAPQNSSTRSKNRMLQLLLYLLALIIGIVLLLLLVLFVFVPFFFLCFSGFEKMIIFYTLGQSHDKDSYNEPIEGLTNLYLDIYDKKENKTLQIGIWDMEPNTTKSYGTLLYFHGTGVSRRDFLEKYEVLRTLFHLVVFDYPWFGDSTPGTLDEMALVDYSCQIFNWLRNKTAGPIYVWGHSLGSAIAVSTLAGLAKQGVFPNGVILESAFTKMAEEVREQKLGRIFKWLPWFSETMITSSFTKNDITFESIRNIRKIKSPILLLHAEDDTEVPYDLGVKLFNSAKLRQNELTFHHAFNGTCRYGHNFIYEAPELPEIVKIFLLICNKTRSNMEVESLSNKLHNFQTDQCPPEIIIKS